MELSFQLIFIIIAISIVLSICFLTIKFFLYPLFIKPKLNSSETFEFLKERNLYFIEKRELNRIEKRMNPFNNRKGSSFLNIASPQTEYIIVGFSESKKEYYFFWLELTKWYVPHIKLFFEAMTGQSIEKRRNLMFKEITEKQILTELKKEFETKNALITDKCPACQIAISSKMNECPNCGLNFDA